MGFPINPPSTALVETDGRTITPEWYRFFREIQKMIGGPSDPFEDSWLLGSAPRPEPDSGIVAFLNPPPAPVIFPDDFLNPPASAGAAADLAAHVAASDPHPVYLTQTEGDARYTAISGALDLNIRTITVTGAPAADDYTLLVDATGGAVTLNLPAAASNTGRVLIAKKIDASANAMTLDGNAAETIDGAATQSTTTQWDAYTVQCNGSGWYIL